MNNLTHPKETGYRSIMYVISGLVWLCIIPIAIAGFLFSIPFAIISWLSSMYFKAQILGDSVKVSNSQYPEIYAKVTEYCNQLNINTVPEVFVYNSNGLLNAYAVKIFMNKFIMLTSTIVDITYKNEYADELNFIIGHELGHHAAGHTSILKSVFLAPAKFIPFIGAAYSRACELTADRYGMFLSNNTAASVNSLVNLAHGSKVLSHKTNIDAFIDQENEIPELMGFISKLYSSHPRLTKRVIELRSFAAQYNIQTANSNGTTSNYNSPHPITHQQTSAPIYSGVQNMSPVTGANQCLKCGSSFDTGDAFCENCGNKLI